MALSVDTSPDELTAIPGIGPLDARVAFVGTAPGITRGAGEKNAPFGRASETLIRKMESVAGEEVYRTNLVKVPHTSKRKVPIKLRRAYHPRFLDEMAAVGPKRILALGTEVAESLCPGFKNLREDHGTMFFNPELGAYVIPTYHFSQISKDQTVLETIVGDAKRVFQLPDPEQPRFEEIQTLARLREVLASLTGMWRVVDIETTGLAFTDALISVGFTDLESDTCYILRKGILVGEWIKAVRREKLGIIGHNLQFDISRLIHWFLPASEWHPPIFDTMVTAHVLGERVLSLKHLTSKYTSRPGSRSQGGTQDNGYLAEDVLSTREVYRWELATLALEDEKPWILDEINQKVSVLANQQNRGVFIDRPFLESLLSKVQRRTARAQGRLTKLFGPINWNANAQIVAAFQAKGIKLTKQTDAGAYSVAEDVIVELAERYPDVQAVLDYREALKEEQFVVSYVELTTAEDPYLRPRLMLTGTDTGRLSCRDPNLQQVPREGPIKLAFRSRWKNGKIGLVDLSQAELRVVALLSGDEELMAALLEGDVHLNIASRIFKKKPEDITPLERKKSKGITFGLLYGGSPAGLAARIGVAVAEVERILEAFFGVFRKLARWLKGQTRMVLSTGRSTTIFGRTRDLHELIVREGRKSAARKAANTPVQSVASDCDLIILGKADELLRRRKMKTRTVLGVHDSIIFDVAPGEDDALIEVMREAFASLNDTPLKDLALWGQLPLVGELVFGASWANVESTNVNYAPERSTPLSSDRKAA